MNRDQTTVMHYFANAVRITVHQLPTMARKEFNIFSISFLDLLSGALGALIIMFIVVPKMTVEQQETIETLDELNVHAANVAEMVEQLENSVDREVAEALQREVAAIQETAQRAQQAAQQLQEENEQLEAELITERQARREAQQTADASASSGRGPEMFGVSAEFAVVSKWQEDLDVDLYFKDVSTGEWCFFRETDPGFAKYLADIRRRERQDDSGYEMVYQQVLKPGTYEVYLHLFSESGTANVETYAVFFPYTPREQKKSLPTRSITHDSSPPNGGGYKLATIVLTQNSFSIQ